ncbi:hypothetical protein J6590_056102 [Homalodisca vitripennis]|nr:hypothetical protein J6590_056102 [Homalodisca vitripennis]
MIERKSTMDKLKTNPYIVSTSAASEVVLSLSHQVTSLGRLAGEGQAEAKSMSKLMKKLQNYELSLPEKKSENEVTEVERYIELDEAEQERAKKLQEIEENISAGALFTQEDYDRIKYEAPLVKQLRTVEVSDNMAQADPTAKVLF